MIPVFNCARYLEDALRSVLEQDPGPEAMQISVVDDVSDDDPAEVINRVAPGRVEYIRHATRQGAPGNFNACVRLARGHWVHILHGDDAVRPGFYEAVGRAARSTSGLGAAFCRTIVMSPDGHWLRISPLEAERPGVIPDMLARLAVQNRIMTPAIVVRREAYEAVGGFRPELIHTADWDLWKRVAARFPIWFQPEPLALYREHQASDTARLMAAAKHLEDLRRAIALGAQYLPREKASVWTKAAQAVHAEAELQRARQLLASGQVRLGFRYLLGIWRLCPTPATALNALAMLGSVAFRLAFPAPHRRTRRLVGS